MCKTKQYFAFHSDWTLRSFTSRTISVTPTPTTNTNQPKPTKTRKLTAIATAMKTTATIETSSTMPIDSRSWIACGALSIVCEPSLRVVAAQCCHNNRFHTTKLPLITMTLHVDNKYTTTFRHLLLHRPMLRHLQCATKQTKTTKSNTKTKTNQSS